MDQSKREASTQTTAQRTDLLFSQSTSVAVGGIIGAMVVFVTLYLTTGDPHLLAWLFAVQLASTVRLVIVRHYLRIQPKGDEQVGWLRLYLITAALVGFSWGLLPIVHLDTESTLVAAIPYLSVGLVATAAIPAYSLRPSAYATFLGSMVITSVVGLVYTHQADSLTMAFFLLVFSAILYSTAIRFSRRLAESLALTEMNQDLLEKMRVSHEDMEAVNKALSQKQAIIDRETEVARHVFNQLIIPHHEQLPEVTYWNQALDNFSGDLVQTAQGPCGKRYLFLGDFTGHGLPAALGAVPTSSVFLAMTKKGMPIEVIASELNDKLNTLLPTGYFCCAVLLEDDPRDETVRILNAGLPAALVVGHQGHTRGSVKSDYLPLGVLPSSSVKYIATELSLHLNDCCYIYSDGVTDAQNPGNESWGNERFQASLALPIENRSRIDGIRSALLDFISEAPPTDDISILEYRKLPLHEVTAVGIHA